MLPCLRHHRFIGGDDQEHEVDPPHPGEHVLDELLVPRDVDEPDLDVSQVEVGEPQVDRDPPLLLFLQAVRVYPRQRPDQRALAMVDVPRRPSD